MATTNYTSVDHYLSLQPVDSQPILQRVRRAIRNALPGADEVISYQIPAYRVDGKTVIFFAGWKKHYSIYPVTDAVLEAFADELVGLEISKGTIRFPLSQPVPAKLIERITAVRAREVASESKQAAAKTPLTGLPILPYIW